VTYPTNSRKGIEMGLILPNDFVNEGKKNKGKRTYKNLILPILLAKGKIGENI